jgi:hypothetical protein
LNANIPGHRVRFVIGRSVVVPVLLAYTLASGLRAEEGGVGHVVPGSAATIIDLVPTEAGFIVQPIYLHYEGDASASTGVPIIGKVAASLNAKSDVALLGGFYTFEQTVLGAHYSVGSFVPYMSVEVTGEIDTAPGERSRKDNASGLGDISLIPVMLAWKSAFWQYSALVPVYTPTGDFSTDSLANAGLNYWTIDPTLSVSYNNAETGLNAALYGGVTYNTENNATDYQSGSMLHFDGSVQQLVPVGSGFLGVGIEGFYFEQVTGDSGDGAKLGNFEGRTMGAGPVLNYILPLGAQTFVAELKWLPESNVEKRLSGDYFWLKFAYDF